METLRSLSHFLKALVNLLSSSTSFLFGRKKRGIGWLGHGQTMNEGILTVGRLLGRIIALHGFQRITSTYKPGDGKDGWMLGRASAGCLNVICCALYSFLLISG